MSQPTHAADETTTAAADRRETEYDDQAPSTARDRTEAEFDDSDRSRSQAADYPVDVRDEPELLRDEPEVRPDERATAAVDDEPARAPSDGKLAPGQATNDPVAALWGADLVERYRTQWRDLQLTFVDDPQRATDAAASLVDDAVASLTNTLQAQKQSLDGWPAAHGGDDTEVMRVALRNYRDFLDRLLGL